MKILFLRVEENITKQKTYRSTWSDHKDGACPTVKGNVRYGQSF